MTRMIRSIGIPAAVLALAACGTNEAGVDSGGASSEPPPATATLGTPSTPPVTPTPSTSSTPPPPDRTTGPSTGLPTPTGPAASPTVGQGPHGPDASRAAFPMKVIRRGGIVGFMDKVTLFADGRAEVTRRGGPPEQCRVDPALMEQVRAAAEAVDWPVGRDAGRPSGTMSDEMIVEVVSGRHHASLDDPGLGKLAGPLGRLLSDITQPEAQRTLCAPV